MQVSLNNIAAGFKEFRSTVGHLCGRVVEVISKRSPAVKAVAALSISIVAIGVLSYVGSMVVKKIKDKLDAVSLKKKEVADAKAAKKQEKTQALVKAQARAIDAEAKARKADATVATAEARAIDAEARAIDAEAKARKADATAATAEAKVMKMELNNEFTNLMNEYIASKDKNVNRLNYFKNKIQEMHLKTDEKDPNKKFYLQMITRFESFEIVLKTEKSIQSGKFKKIFESTGHYFRSGGFCSLYFKNRELFTKIYIEKLDKHLELNPNDLSKEDCNETKTFLLRSCEENKNKFQQPDEESGHLNITNPIEYKIGDYTFLV